MNQNGHGQEHEPVKLGGESAPPVESGAEARRTRDGGDDRTLGQLFRELTRETSALVRAEVALARSELDESVGEAKKGAASMATGGAVLLAGCLTLIAFIVLALDRVLPAWAAALIVGAIITLVGIVLVLMGRSKIKEQDLNLPRTRASLRQQRQLVTEHER